VARPARSIYQGHRFFHAYSRGVDRMAISRDDGDRKTWVSLLARTTERFGWKVWTYCLMPNHFHLVVEAELDDLSDGMHWLNGVYAQRFNRRHKRTGHVFQGRFNVRVIADEARMLPTCEYVLDNPVRAGLCDCAEEWPWSGAVFWR
jgi:REP element-mobilizing transposase RayT